MRFESPVRASLVATPGGPGIPDGPTVTPDPTQTPPGRGGVDDSDGESLLPPGVEIPFGLTEQQALLAGGGGLFILLLLLAAI